MEQFFSNPNTAALIIPILGIPMVLIIALAAIWLKYKKAEMEAVLKQDMIQRGMSADDILRVLEAKPSPSGCGHLRHTPQQTTDFNRS